MFEVTPTDHWPWWVATDAQRGAAVREIDAPPRRDGDMSMNEMLLTWSQQEITFRAERRNFSEFGIDTEGGLVEVPRLPIVEILRVGAAQVGRDGTAYAEFFFESEAEYSEAVRLAAEGYVAWFPFWKSDTVEAISRQRTVNRDPLLGELPRSDVRAIEVRPVRY